MLKDTISSLEGNDRFEGFCIDVIQEISKMLGFQYTFIVQKDGNNGKFDRATQTWDGMIGEILSGVNGVKNIFSFNNLSFQGADLAITDLTITSERETATDFTSPFMNLGSDEIKLMIDCTEFSFFRYKHTVQETRAGTSKPFHVFISVLYWCLVVTWYCIFYRLHLPFYYGAIVPKRMDEPLSLH